LKVIRGKFYDLLTKGISPDMIIGVMVREFLSKKSGQQIPDYIKPEVLKHAVIYEHRCKDGTKAIMHLEAFAARVMCLYRSNDVQINTKFNNK
jgi:replication factor C subunit 3/5